MTKRFARGLGALLTFGLITALVAAFALAGTKRVQDGSWQVPTRHDLVQLVVPRSFTPPAPSKTIYLMRDEVTVSGGIDDMTRLQTSLVPRGESRRLPRYRASNKTWNRLVSCVADRFNDFDVIVTDERPLHGDFVLVKVGGEPADLGMKGRKIGGIAPFTGFPMPQSMVFVFDQGGTFRTRNNCETAAHEVAHVYGLDHTNQCKDIMSYKHGCGMKVFVDKEMSCGEDKLRPCQDKRKTQNSAGRLLDVLGPKPEAPLVSMNETKARRN